MRQNINNDLQSTTQNINIEQDETNQKHQMLQKSKQILLQ